MRRASRPLIPSRLRLLIAACLTFSVAWAGSTGAIPAAADTVTVPGEQPGDLIIYPDATHTMPGFSYNNRISGIPPACSGGIQTSPPYCAQADYHKYMTISSIKVTGYTATLVLTMTDASHPLTEFYSGYFNGYDVPQQFFTAASHGYLIYNALQGVDYTDVHGVNYRKCALGVPCTVAFSLQDDRAGYIGDKFIAASLYGAPSALGTVFIPLPHATQIPTAAFDSHPNTHEPGQYQFVSNSSDPQGQALDQKWTLGDGATASGPAVTHTYSKPGIYHVGLTVTNASGLTDTVTHDVVVKAPDVSVSIAFVDTDGTVLPTVNPKVGGTFRVRVTAYASDDGVGDLHDVRFADAPLTVTPPGVVSLGAATPAPPDGFTLAPGASKAFVYTATVTAAGVFRFRSSVTAKDALDRAVGPATNQLSASVDSLQVTITLDPASIVQDEDLDGPKPVDVTATITVANLTDKPATDVILRSLTTTPAKTGQIIKIEQTSGPVPDPIEGFALPSLAAGATGAPITAKFRATDDGEIDVAALVTATGDAATLRGLGKARLSIKPKYLLQFKSQLVHPNGGLLPAGKLIEIRGTVKNLSDTATLHVGPTYPQAAGNAGLMGLSYDGKVVSPYDPAAPPELILDPNQTRSFTLQITTAYSDPRTYPDATGSKVAKTGGTRATLTFTPWAEATLEDGTKKLVPTEDVLTDKANLEKQASIDDSIPIPQTNYAKLAGALTVGAIEGVYNACVGLLWGVTQLAKLPYTTFVAAIQFQTEVWKSFSPEERAYLVDHTAERVLATIRRNIGQGARDSAKLLEQIKATTLMSMTKLEDEWRVGDYAETARTYAEFGTEQIASVAVPIAMAALAKSPAAVAALRRGQDAIQARMAPILGGLGDLRRIEQIGPILTTIVSGTELDAEQIRILYGISAEELAELQALATKYKFLLTVRSRHDSSLTWIRDKFAMLKPESLKIKTVSLLDSRLGYGFDDIGSLVFRKPEALALWEKSGLGEGELAAYVRDFVRSKGFTPGTGEYYEAISRVTLRSEEWNKWDRTYQQWSKQKWLPTTFDYKGNAAQVSTARSQFPKMNGFRLRPVGTDEYIVEMYNWEKGRFVPVTGDIDPISFTHMDGSPLSAEEHASLLDDMQESLRLQTQHGESATYVKGGLQFVSEQFKPGEAGLQIAPGGLKPRVVRLNVGKSRWVNPFNYNLHWDGGFVALGTAPDAAGYPAYLAPATLARQAAAQKSTVLPLPSISTEPTVGRCKVLYDNANSAQPLLMSADGVISTFAPPATTLLTPDTVDNTRCFEPGPVVPLTVRPTNVLPSSVSAGVTEIPIVTQPGLAPSNAGGDSEDVGFTVGDEVVIGAGTPDAETATISAFGSLILSHPLRHAHAAGEVIVVTHVSHSGGVASTGVPVSPLVPIGALLLLSGAVLEFGGRRRRMIERSAA